MDDESPPAILPLRTWCLLPCSPICGVGDVRMARSILVMVRRAKSSIVSRSGGGEMLDLARVVFFCDIIDYAVKNETRKRR